MPKVILICAKICSEKEHYCQDFIDKYGAVVLLATKTNYFVNDGLLNEMNSFFQASTKEKIYVRCVNQVK